MTDTDKIAEKHHRENMEMVEKRHRENMDALTFKALVALNGGGTIALLTFSSAIMDNKGLQDAAFFGILLLVMALALAVLYNIFRRKCSLEYQNGLGAHGVPCICRLGHICQVLSLVLFFGGAVCVPVAHLAFENKAADVREETTR